MEITRFRLQLSTALEQVKVRLWQVRYRLRKLRRFAAVTARKLGQKLRTGGNALRVWLVAAFREAIVAASSKISKGKAQVFIILKKGFEKRIAQLRETWNRLARMKRSIAEKVQKTAEESCAREDEWRGMLAARSRKTISGASSKISKAEAQASIIITRGFKKGFERGTAQLRRAQNPLVRLKRSIAARREKLAEEGRARELQKPPKELRAPWNELRLLEAKPREAIARANSKITTVTAQPPAAPEEWTAHLLEAHNPLAGLARSFAEEPPKPAEGSPAQLQKPLERLPARGNELHLQVVRPREAVVTADSKSGKVEAQLPMASEKGTARLRQVQKRLSGLGRNIVDKRRRKRQELGARESQMHDLLAKSLDAVVVISGDHRFVTANRRALDLFGVSERNLSKFNIDAFLCRGQITDLQGDGVFFKGRQERHGKCTIRRLDGSLRVAEVAFVADFLPLHLYRFYDLCMPQWPTPIQHRIGPGTQDGSHAGQAH